MLVDFETMTLDELREMCGAWRPLERQDEIAIRAFFDLLQRYRTARDRLNEIPVEDWGTTEGRSLNSQLRGAGDQILSWCKNFGMTPADRARLGDPAPSPEGSSDFSQMVDRAQTILNN
jgi:hypothetical protein